MKTRVLILIAVATLLLTGSVALAQSGGQPPPSSYAVERGVASGGCYHLDSLAWRVNGAASSVGYRLLSPAAPASSEKGCCCNYLPCVLRDYP